MDAMVVAMKVLVNGIGNFGTTLLQVLTAHWDLLDTDTVYAHKSTVHPWDEPQMQRLKNLGIILVGDEYPAQARIEDVAHEIDYVFDAGRPGQGLRRKARYDGFPNLLGASAQGTEKSFGTPYVLGHGMDSSLSRHASIPSCNTHSALAVLRTLSDGDLQDIESADFVMARRSVAGNVVARHLDPVLGTHHAIDTAAVLRVLGRRIPIQSSDLSTPSQFLHATRFAVRLRSSPTEAQVRDRIDRSAYVSNTGIFDSNKIFEIGRRFGLGGRLYQQAIFVDANLLVKDRVISGWAFVPQEGNTILSTMAAYLQRTRGLREASRRIDQLAESVLLTAL
ncbi:MAG: hypothetical protein L0H93_16345 [Nocardioides sp.]|nr:hypothetical protein [Nocardioides sp.]